MTEERARYYAKVLARSMGVTFYAVRSREGRFLAVQVPSEVACVKFSNLTMVLGNAGDRPPASVASVAAGWVDRLQLLEVELGNGLQLIGQSRPFEAGRQIVEPSAVFVLQGDQCRYRRRPAFRPWQRAPRQRQRTLPEEPGPVPRLTLGCGHRQGADTRPGHCFHICGNRDCHVCQLKLGWLWLAKHGIKRQFLCSIEAPFLRPDLAFVGRRAPPQSRLAAVQATAAGAREAVLRAASTAPDWTGWERHHAACRSASFLCSARCCMFR